MDPNKVVNNIINNDENKMSKAELKYHKKLKKPNYKISEDQPDSDYYNESTWGY